MNMASLGLLTSLALLPSGAEQASLCGPAQAITQGLQDKYGELPHGAGVMADGTYAVLVIAPKGATWTFFALSSDKACFIAAGRDWHDAPSP